MRRSRGLRGERTNPGGVNDTRSPRPPFGALLRKRRIDAGLSQEQLAERARISVQAVSALERGARLAPRADTLALLATSLALEGSVLTEFEATARTAVPTKIRRNGGTAAPFDPAARRGLPEFDTTFVGRERDVAEVVAALATGRCVTIWGTGGLGKTRLATESLRTLAASSDARVAFVPLAPASGDDAVVPAVAAAFDLVDDALDDLLAHLAARYADSAVLIVLDNCEHVLEGAARFAGAALARLPGSRVLATSREPLRIGAERVIRLNALAASDAVRLFFDRAGHEIASAATPSDRASVATICQRLDGLALAIELAAARTRSMPVRDIERALDERFSLLTRGSRTADARHQTLRTTIAWSYDLLEPVERTIFERLAFLSGPFDIEHAIAIACDDAIDSWCVLDTVADLVDQALVAFATDGGAAGGRYAMLESTRLFGATLPPERRADGDGAAARRRFGAWSLERAEVSFVSFVRDREHDHSGIEIDHLRAYLRWAIDDGGDVETAGALAGMLMHSWSAWGLASEGLRWIDAALPRVADGAPQRRSRAKMLFGKANLLHALALHRESLPPAREAYACALAVGRETPGDLLLLGRAAFMVAETAAFAGEGALASEAIAVATSAYESLGQRHGTFLCLTAAGNIASYAGDFPTARDCHVRAIAYFDESGHRRLAAHTRVNVAEIDFLLGDTARAVETVREALPDLLELSTLYYTSNALANLASYLCARDEMAAAAPAARDALRAARDGRFPTAVARVYEVCAALAIASGDASAGAHLFGWAERFATATYRAGSAEMLVRERVRKRLANALAPHELATAMRRGASLEDDELDRLALAAIDA